MLESEEIYKKCGKKDCDILKKDCPVPRSGAATIEGYPKFWRCGCETFVSLKYEKNN